MKPSITAACALASISILGAMRAEAGSIAEFISDKPQPFTWRASISIGADEDGKTPAKDLVHWTTKTKSEEHPTISAPEGRGPGYRFETESVVHCWMGYSRFVQTNMDLKVMWQNRTYELIQSVTLALEKVATFKVGTTPEGQAIWLHLTPQATWLAPDKPVKQTSSPSIPAPAGKSETAIFVAAVMRAAPFIAFAGSNLEFPPCPNPVADLLPGKMYDPRAYFALDGINLAPDDIAWYHIKGGVFIIRASPENIALLRKRLDFDSEDLPSKVMLDAGIVIASESASWQMRADNDFNGKWFASAAASGGKTGITYHCRIDGELSKDNKSLDYKLTLGVAWNGHTYKSEKSDTVPMGEKQTISLGETPDGKTVSFYFTPSCEVIQPVSVLDDTALKERLLEWLRTGKK